MPDLPLWTPGEALPSVECALCGEALLPGERHSEAKAHDPICILADAVRVAVDPWAKPVSKHMTVQAIAHHFLTFVAAHPDTEFHVWTDVVTAQVWMRDNKNWPINLILHPKEAPDDE